MQPTTVLSDSPSIQFMRQDEGRGGRGGSGFSSLSFCVLSLFFFLFFFLSLSLRIVTRTRKRQTDRQTESLNSLRLASPRSWNSPACLKPPFSRASAFFRFLFPPPPLLLSFSINQSIKQPRASKQVVHHHHIKWASNPPKPNSSSPRKLCANAIRISAGAIGLFIEVVDLCMLNEEVRICHISLSLSLTHSPSPPTFPISIPISPFQSLNIISHHQKKKQKKEQKTNQTPSLKFPNIPLQATVANVIKIP